jgi:hypothetical protein
MRLTNYFSKSSMMFVLMLAAFFGSAQTLPSYNDLHDFGGTVTNSDGKTGPDGTGAYSGVTFDSAGDMIGTSCDGGANGAGAIWEIVASGTYKVLHDFGGTLLKADGKNITSAASRALAKPVPWLRGSKVPHRLQTSLF